MSVSQETMDMMATAIKKGENIEGSLIRSKLINRLLWDSPENNENDPYAEYLSLISDLKQLKKLEMEQVHGGRVVLGENQACGYPLNERSVRKNGTKHEENWRGQWENLKKTGHFCSLCKNNKEGREIYMSHNLKGPNGEVTCPILLACVCQCCGKKGHTMEIHMSHNLKGTNGEVTCPILLTCVCQCCGKKGHTVAYCSENETGTNVLRMINHHNRI